MTSPLLSSLCLILAFASPAFAGDLTAAERTALAAQSGADIASLRAGESEAVPPIAEAERTELAHAAASAAGLDALRAGDMDNDDLTVVGAVVAVVILGILIF